MNKISDDKLDNITGGNTTVNGPIINAIVNVINLLRDAGYSVGSGIRRISENKMCPLD
ncbi:MAG: bacteriocin [Bacilli bacterium]|nr:bacteriocin [Bacilli bacterium]